MTWLNQRDQSGRLDLPAPPYRISQASRCKNRYSDMPQRHKYLAPSLISGLMNVYFFCFLRIDRVTNQQGLNLLPFNHFRRCCKILLRTFLIQWPFTTCNGSALFIIWCICLHSHGWLGWERRRSGIRLGIEWSRSRFWSSMNFFEE